MTHDTQTKADYQQAIDQVKQEYNTLVVRQDIVNQAINPLFPQRLAIFADPNTSLTQRTAVLAKLTARLTELASVIDLQRVCVIEHHLMLEKQAALPKEATDTDAPVVCSFCGKTQHDVLVMVAGPTPTSICSECVELSMEIVEERKTGKAPPPKPTKPPVKKPPLSAPKGLSQAGASALVRIKLFMQKHKLETGCKVFYSPEQWEAKGEKPKPNCELVVVYDGSDLNGVINGTKRGNLMDELRDSLQAVGVYLEPDSGWFAGIYKIPTDKE